jgi:hypothetical protein
LTCVKARAGARIIMDPIMNRIRAWLTVCALALAAGCAAPAGGPEARTGLDTLRGGDLYRTYCNACHTAQVHWREKRLVKSWDDLLFQASRWQRIAGQDWSREEIEDVAAYLNALFYDVPCPQAGCGSSTQPLKRS